MTDKSEVQAIVAEELDRNNAAVVELITRHPDIRTSIACAFLGAAVATADTIGVDVEGFIESLRKRHEKPAVLVPPRVHVTHLDILGDSDDFR